MPDRKKYSNEVRGREIYTNLEPDFTLKQGDYILFNRDRENMNTVLNYVKEKP